MIKLHTFDTQQKTPVYGANLPNIGKIGETLWRVYTS